MHVIFVPISPTLPMAVGEVAAAVLWGTTGGGTTGKRGN